MRINRFLIFVVLFSQVSFAEWTNKKSFDPLVFNSSNPKTIPQSDLAFFGNNVFLPNGFDANEQYSALLILPSCAGMVPPKIPDLKNLALEAASRGFVTMVVDSLGPRGQSKPPFNCARNKLVPMDFLVGDLFSAVKFLSALPYVSSDEVFAIGQSYGAMTISTASSAMVQRRYPEEKQYLKAGTGLYGGCDYGYQGKKKHVFRDTVVPLLWLMGGRDKEAPVSGCTNIIKYLDDKNVGFEHHIFEEATHCWDCIGSDGLARVAANGNKVVYEYNKTITEESYEMAFSFFNKFRTNIPDKIFLEVINEKASACLDPSFAAIVGDACSD